MKRTLCAIAAIAVAAVAGAQMELPPVAADSAVRMGRLDNGLTYYVRYNNWPENRADFYIAQKVGSLQEEEEQRGLAHFLEHMCFNGTQHFPGDSIMRYCESIGVMFGEELNAYTGTDETVYNISNVPTYRQATLDSCLLILYDWADGLVLDPVEIDKERGVIHEEWRLRTSSIMRMLERSLPRLYSGSKYGYRMPIGLMSVVDSFKPQTLRDYYEKWYRPDNQAIIVVGDVDVDRTVAQIEKLFGAIAADQNPARVEPVAVPDNAEPIVVVDKDKEQRFNMIELMIKHEPTPDSLKGNVAYLMTSYMVNTAVSMLSERLAELAKKPESPFVSAGAGHGQYILSRTKDALDITAVPKDGQTEATLAAILREARRAAAHGFTPTEYARARANTLSALDKMYSNRDKRYSNQFCEEYKEHFLAAEPIPSVDDYYEMMKWIVPMTPLEAINETMAELAPPTHSNIVVMSFNTDKADSPAPPTEQALKETVERTLGETLQPYVDNVRNEPLIEKMPTPGEIVSTKEDTLLGYKTLTLSNGATVLLKPTDHKRDQVLLSATGFGGSALYGEADYANIKIFDDAVEASGLGNFSHTELEKALAGKVAGASLDITSQRQTVSGSSTPNDIETLLQLVYLYFTNIKEDNESFSNMMNTARIALQNKALSPDNAFSDSLTMTLNSHNPRFAPLTMSDLERVDYRRILQMARERTANAAAFTFTIVGNFSPDSIAPLIKQYIASLPGDKNRVEKGPRVDTDAEGTVVNSFRRKMETPKATAMMVWKSDAMDYNLTNIVRADMAGQVLSMIYLKKIREDASAAYTVGAQGTVSRLDHKTDAAIMALCPMKPEKAELALGIMRAEVGTMGDSVDAQMLAKVKEYMLKAADDREKTNGYWLSAIALNHYYGLNVHTLYKQTVAEQTPETVASFVKELTAQGNRVEVVMMPEGE